MLAEYLVTVFCVAYGGYCIRVSWRQWHESESVGVPMNRRVPTGYSSRKIIGLQRAKLPLGIASLSLAAVIVCTIPAGDDSGQVSNALAIVLLVCIVLFMASSASIALVVWFNRPKILVPPNRRNELGSFADWKASR